MYMTMLMNHVRAVRNWTEKNSAQTSIDMASFQMEVKVRHRYYTLHPQFRARVNDRLANVPHLTEETTGFLGWLPYRPIQWNLSTEKLQFKAYAAEHGLRTPRWWNASAMPEQDFIVKTSRGSWGMQVRGPFQAGTPVAGQELLPETQGEAFAEQFILGTNLKIWIWGRTVFHVHAHPYASVTGDGLSTVDELVEQLAQTQSPRAPRPVDDALGLESCLRFQGLTRNDIPLKGQSVWLDFRYGRDYRSPVTTEAADNCLPQLPKKILDQAMAAAEVLERDLMSRFGAPILYSLDGVADLNDDVWWLEVNSNPSLPPSGYPHMFAALFGTTSSV
jgi:hypothetical protein